MQLEIELAKQPNAPTTTSNNKVETKDLLKE